MKICTGCRIEKLLSDFSPRRDRRSQMSQCKKCCASASLAKHWAYRKRMSELKNEPCMDCGGRFPSCAMDFDHRDPSTKLFQFNTFRSWEKVLVEITKCDLVCANCHRVRTQKRARELASS